ncbi:Methylated-DNA--protein-cysteine methyltransferase, constitutive [compost metagenome]
MNKLSMAASADVTTVYYSEMQSLIGDLTLCATDKGLCLVRFGPLARTRPDMEKWLAVRIGKVELQSAEEPLAEVKHQLTEYFSGQRRDFSLPLDMRGTPFQLQVWTALRTIPYGASASYKDMALAAGNVKAVRAVGGANNRNPIPVIVPCHRVIGAAGALVGYAGGLRIKSCLLELEAGQTAPDQSGIYLF